MIARGRLIINKENQSPGLQGVRQLEMAGGVLAGGKVRGVRLGKARGALMDEGGIVERGGHWKVEEETRGGYKEKITKSTNYF